MLRLDVVVMPTTVSPVIEFFLVRLYLPDLVDARPRLRRFLLKLCDRLESSKWLNLLPLTIFERGTYSEDWISTCGG